MMLGLYKIAAVVFREVHYIVDRSVDHTKDLEVRIEVKLDAAASGRLRRALLLRSRISAIDTAHVYFFLMTSIGND